MTIPKCDCGRSKFEEPFHHAIGCPVRVIARIRGSMAHLPGSMSEDLLAERRKEARANHPTSLSKEARKTIALVREKQREKDEDPADLAQIDDDGLGA